MRISSSVWSRLEDSQLCTALIAEEMQSTQPLEEIREKALSGSKTLAHEIAHYYSEGVFRIPRQDAETIAESAAFVVGAHYGFDSGVRSFPYVALWARDKKVLQANLGAIRKVSTTILEELEK